MIVENLGRLGLTVMREKASHEDMPMAPAYSVWSERQKTDVIRIRQKKRRLSVHGNRKSNPRPWKVRLVLIVGVAIFCALAYVYLPQVRLAVQEVKILFFEDIPKTKRSKPRNERHKVNFRKSRKKIQRR